MSRALFYTKHFRFTIDEFHFLRGGFPYRKVKFEEIEHLTIRFGVGTKYPIRTLIYGVLMFFLGIWIFLYLKDFLMPLVENPADKLHGGVHVAKGYNGALSVPVFFLVSGIASLLLALRPVAVLQIELHDGTRGLFSLRKLKKKEDITEFVRFLKENITSNRLQIDPACLRQKKGFSF